MKVKKINQKTILILFGLLTLIAVETYCTTLQYMAQIFSHGARYSVHDYYDYNQTKQFSGMLTSVGLRQQYLLGNYVQNQYANSKDPLLTKTLNPRQVELFALNYYRVQQSAYANALGLFPFNLGETISPTIDPSLLLPPFQTIFPSSLKFHPATQTSPFSLQSGFQPVPIRYANSFFPQCPAINVLLTKRGQLISKDLAQFQAEQSAFTDKMRLVFNMSLTQANLAGISDLADTIISDRYLNRPLPAAFTQSDYNQIYYVRAVMLASLYAGEVAATINTPFINALISNIQAKISNHLDIKKYSSYAIQPENIIPLLTYYNLTSADCIKKVYKNQTLTGVCVDPLPYSSNLIFELHQSATNSSEYFVKTRYNGVYYKLWGKSTVQIAVEEFITKSKLGLFDFNKQCNVKSVEQQVISQQTVLLLQ